MRVFSLVFMILGCLLGAGFVSGKEIATYFSTYGRFSILGILLLTILIFLLLIFFLSISNKVSNFREFVFKYFGKQGDFLNFLFAFTMLIFIGSMFAGTFVLSHTFNFNKVILVVITIILTYLLTSGKKKIISIVNLILMPIIICVMLYLTVTPNLGIGGEGNFMLSILSSISYGFVNIVPVGVFIIDIKGDKNLNKKEIFLIALITSVIIFVLLMIFNNAIITNNLVGESMPILSLAECANPFVKTLSVISLYIGLLTTLVSSVYVLSNYINGYLYNQKHSTMLSLILGLVVSFFGFDIIVGYVYILISLIGIYIVLSVVIKERRNLKNIKFLSR